MQTATQEITHLRLQLDDRLVAILGLRRDGLFDDAADAFGNTDTHAGHVDRHHLPGFGALQYTVDVAGVAVGQLTADNFVQNRAEPEDVAALVHLFRIAARLLGRHVRRRPYGPWCLHLRA